MTETVLEVRDVTKRFGAITALDSVSLSLGQGDVLGLVGDNGAGKSTLIKILSGVERATEGAVYLYGEEVDFASPADARDAGIEAVHQTLGLVGGLDVASNFFLGRELTWGPGPIGILRHAEMRRRSEEALKELSAKIPGILSDRVGNMSGGQRQAVAIARAAFWRSRVLLLDEPTAALGVEESSQVMKLLQKMAAEGLPMIVISHNFEHIWQMCNRIAVLRQGRLVGSGDRSEFTTDQVVSLITGSTEVHHH